MPEIRRQNMLGALPDGYQFGDAGRDTFLVRMLSPTGLALAEALRLSSATDTRAIVERDIVGSVMDSAEGDHVTWMRKYADPVVLKVD